MSGTPAALLLTSLREFLREEVMPQLSGVSAYNTRIAANLLDILARERELGDAIASLDREFVSSRGLSTDTPSQNLAIALRDGTLPADAALFAYLRRRALLTLAIDNPRYSGYLQARERWTDEDNP